MALPVVAGATVICTMGLAPGTLNVTSQRKMLLNGAPVATIQDSTPANITPCGLCTSLANPQVASATAAALGVLTPMPCTPMPTGTWLCAKNPLVAGLPGLSQDGKLLCSFAGSLSILAPGQMKAVY